MKLAVLHRAVLSCCLTVPGATWAAPVVLNVVADSLPPYLVQTAAGLAGPYADAFRLLMAQRGVSVSYRAMPVARALSQVASQSNTCALAVNFDQGLSETLNFVGVIAPVTLSVYQRAGSKTSVSKLDDLRKLVVGGMDIAEVRDVMGSAGIAFFPVRKAELGFAMLNAGRFNVFLSDIGPQAGQTLKSLPMKAFVLTRAERWVVCNAQLSPSVLTILRAQLRDGLFAPATASVWQRYGMAAYYQEVRSQRGSAP